jgi:hypothetical protein
MSPEAEPASPIAAAEQAVPQSLLQDGEVILLAVKPSPWWVVLNAWPVLAVLGLVGLGGYVAEDFVSTAIRPRTVLLFCIAVAGLRIAFGGCQWMGTLYVLTNQRVLWIRGAWKASLTHCPLSNIHQAHVSTSPSERIVGIGSLFFSMRDGDVAEPVWPNIARPADVQEIVNDTIRRSR